jgi:hypothetical protein
MIRFKKYVTEKTMFGMEKYEKELSALGFEYKIVSAKKVALITDKNRIQVLKDLMKQFPGSTYQPVISGSSAGGLVTADGFTILAKPKKASGSGAGAAMTALAESAQCLYCAAVWYGNSDFSVDGLRSVYKHTNVTESLDKMANQLPADWQDAAMASAKKLHEKFGNMRYKFHRGSSWVNALETKFKELNRKEKQFSNVNKWSPADIYMVSAEGEKEDFKGANSIVELNAIILKNLQDRTIVPVSLKKVSSDSVSLKYINFTNDKSTYEIKNPSYTIGKKGFFASKDVYMYFVDGEIQFRGFNVVDFQGEIKGRFSAHGKIGGGVIKKVVNKTIGFEMEMATGVAKRLSKDRDSFYKDFHKYYKAVVSSPLDYNKFVAECMKKDEGWHISKYLGTQMLYAIKNSNKSKLEEIIGGLIGYAASESELSAAYVKVS